LKKNQDIGCQQQNGWLPSQTGEVVEAFRGPERESQSSHEPIGRKNAKCPAEVERSWGRVSLRQHHLHVEAGNHEKDFNCHDPRRETKPSEWRQYMVADNGQRQEQSQQSHRFTRSGAAQRRTRWTDCD